MTPATSPDTRTSTVSSSAPRLRLEPTGTRHALLDGGWWPRSTDPVAELPGLVLAIDRLRGPVTRLLLSPDGWDSQEVGEAEGSRRGANPPSVRLGKPRPSNAR